MTIELAQRTAIEFLNDNIVSENVNEAIRLLVSKTLNLTVEDVINKLCPNTYINIIENGYSKVYCKAIKLNEDLKRRYVKCIMGDSRYAIQIYI